MLISKQILVSALALGACVLNLTGCGQTGSLYLPPPATATKPSAVAPASAATAAPATAPTPSSEPKAP